MSFSHEFDADMGQFLADHGTIGIVFSVDKLTGIDAELLNSAREAHKATAFIRLGDMPADLVSGLLEQFALDEGSEYEDLEPLLQSEALGCTEPEALGQYLFYQLTGRFHEKGNSMNQLVKLLSLLVSQLTGSDDSKKPGVLLSLSKAADMEVKHFSKILAGEVTELSDEELEGLSKALAAGSQDPGDDEVANLKTKIARLQAQIDGAGEDQAKIAKLEQKLEAMELAQSNQENDRLIADCKVPAMRNFLRSLYEMARGMGDKKVRLYSVEKKDFVDEDAVQIVTQFRDLINEKFAKYFTESGAGGNDRSTELEDAGEEVHKRTEEYMAKNDEKSYSVAMNKVLEADSDLAQRYAGGLN